MTQELWDKICSLQSLKGSWRKVKDNQGGPGTDQVTLEQFERNLEQNLAGLQSELERGNYQPLPLLRRYINKGNSTKRPIGIPAIRDRVNDSLAKKDKNTHRLDLVDLHYDHLESTKRKAVYKSGVAYVVCKIEMGSFNYTFNLRPYLREHTACRINRKRPKGKRIPFHSKYKIAHEMLEGLKESLPEGY